MKQPKAAKAKAKGGSAASRRPKRGTGKSVSQHHHQAAAKPGGHQPAHPHHPGGSGAGKVHKPAVGGGHKPAHPHHAKAPAKKAAKRGLGEVACCAAEALRGSQGFAEPSDVLKLYRHTAESPDAGASILATLEAASEYGLAGIRPVSFAAVDLDDPAAVILGVDLPGAHAVAVAGCGCWWSWGALFDPAEFPDAVIEEAWTLQWAA